MITVCAETRPAPTHAPVQKASSLNPIQRRVKVSAHSVASFLNQNVHKSIPITVVLYVFFFSFTFFATYSFCMLLAVLTIHVNVQLIQQMESTSFDFAVVHTFVNI